MSAALHPASFDRQSVPPIQPAEPAHAAQPAPTAPPTTSAHLLFLVRTLITFGSGLARVLASSPGLQILNGFISLFRTTDLGLIMDRIIRGLRMAEALEQRLLRNARQIDNPRLRLYIPRPPVQPGEPDAAATAPQDATDKPSGIPTVQEIADQIRHRPIGAVLADICRNLGINQGHSAWYPLCAAVAAHGGNLLRFLEDSIPNPRPAFAPASPQPLAAPPAPAPAGEPTPAASPFAFTPATGPP